MSDSDVHLYLKEISRHKLLTPDEERELARRIRQGDQEARNEMVLANLRLVVSIAKNYVERGLPLLDLIEEGNIGLLKAVERFNPEEGCKFSTYASWWIKQTMRRALISKVKNVRVPAYMVELLSKWRRATEHLMQTLGRKPSPEEIAREVGVDVGKLPALRRAILAQGGVPRGQEATFIQDIEDEEATAPGGDDGAVDLTDGRPLADAMSVVLSERECLVLRLRFGLGPEEQSITLEQIGKRIGLTRERVRQIEAQALNRLFCFLTGEEAAPPSKKRERRARARGGPAPSDRVAPGSAHDAARRGGDAAPGRAPGRKAAPASPRKGRAKKKETKGRKKSRTKSKKKRKRAKKKRP